MRARERFKILIPLVFFIIFMLLYMTFHSASEATIVMLSVVYAMTGGVILQWWLGYNFSVAVWVGYIALYGVAVQTGVVMVLYLHEALDKRLRARGRRSRKRTSVEATIAGSVLRLRPKLMTVSVVMAGAGADPVEHWRRVRHHETDRRADHRRHGDVDDSRPDHHAGHLLHHEDAARCARHAQTVRYESLKGRRASGSADDAVLYDLYVWRAFGGRVSVRTGMAGPRRPASRARC